MKLLRKIYGQVWYLLTGRSYLGGTVRLRHEYKTKLGYSETILFGNVWPNFDPFAAMRLSEPARRGVFSMVSLEIKSRLIDDAFENLYGDEK
jgi:hypothetical protein